MQGRAKRAQDRWRLATTMGWYFFGFMLLLAWSGPDSINFIGPLTGGVVSVV